MRLHFHLLYFIYSNSYSCFCSTYTRLKVPVKQHSAGPTLLDKKKTPHLQPHRPHATITTCHQLKDEIPSSNNLSIHSLMSCSIQRRHLRQRRHQQLRQQKQQHATLLLILAFSSSKHEEIEIHQSAGLSRNLAITIEIRHPRKSLVQCHESRLLTST